MNVYFFFFALVFIGMSVSCQDNLKPSDQNNCKDAYRQAYKKLNNYYQQGNLRELDTALAIVEENIQACQDYRSRMVNLKIRLLILTKAYDRGYRFVDSLEAEKFNKSYQKNLYLKSFKAMSLNEQGDSLNGNRLYRDIVDEILTYIKKHPTDNETVADLFFTKVKVEDKIKVLNEIEIMQHQHEGSDSIFYEGLKTAIREGENTVSAIPGY